MTRKPGRPATTRAPTSSTDVAERIYAVVRDIPRGCVATYGEIANLAGIPSGHRVAARAMRVCPESLPWQRVLGKKDARRGQINIDEPDHAALQRALLEAEGVIFDANGFVSLQQCGWLQTSLGQTRGTRRRARPAPPVLTRRERPRTKPAARAVSPKRRPRQA